MDEARARRGLSSFWCADVRDRIAAQVEHIRHWRIIHGDYRSSPDITATWHVDCPYIAKGRAYRAKLRDHEALGLWCRQRDGQVMVCEQSGATWLPFRDFYETAPGTRGKTHEVIWTND